MSYEVYAGDEGLGQFASGGGYHDLVEAARGGDYPALAQLFADGETGQGRKCASELNRLAVEAPEDIRETALGLAKMIARMNDIVITDGVIEDDGEEEAEKEDGGPDLPEDVVGLPVEARSLFCKALNSHFDGGASEVMAHIKAYQAIEDAGFFKYDPDQPRDSQGQWGEGGSGSTKTVPSPELMKEKNFRDAWGFVKEKYGHLLATDALKRIDKRNFVPGGRFNGTLAVTNVGQGGKSIGMGIREKQSAKSYVDTLVHELTHVAQAQRGAGLSGGSPRESYNAYRENVHEKEAWAAGTAAGKAFAESRTKKTDDDDAESTESGTCPGQWEFDDDVRKDPGLSDVHVNRPLAVPDKGDEELRHWLSQDKELKEWLDSKDLKKFDEDEPRDDAGKWTAGGSGGPEEAPGRGKDPFGVFRENSAKAFIANVLGDGKPHTLAELKQVCADRGVKVGQIYTALGDLRAKGYEFELSGRSIRVTNADPLTGKPIPGGGTKPPEPSPKDDSPRPTPPPPEPPAPKPTNPATGIARTFTATKETLPGATEVVNAFRAQHPEIVGLLEQRPLNGLKFPSKFTFPGADYKSENVAGFYTPWKGRVTLNSNIDLTQQFGHTQRDATPSGQLTSNFYTNTHNVGFDSASKLDRKVAVMVHEVGHHIDNKYVEKTTGTREQLFRAWDNAKATGRYVSQYSKVNQKEYFAEAFTAYHVSPGKLKEIDPQGHALIASVMKRWGSK